MLKIKSKNLKKKKRKKERNNQSKNKFYMSRSNWDKKLSKYQKLGERKQL